MFPQKNVINPNTLLDLSTNKTVAIVVEKGIIRSYSIILDTTHTLSKSNPIPAINVLPERSKQL